MLLMMLCVSTQATGWLHKADVKTALAGFFKQSKKVVAMLLLLRRACCCSAVCCQGLKLPWTHEHTTMHTRKYIYTHHKHTHSFQVERLAEVLEALDTDEPGDALHYSCLFSDDDEMNQGLTAEIIRSQHLTERLEFLQVLAVLKSSLRRRR